MFVSCSSMDDPVNDTNGKCRSSEYGSGKDKEEQCLSSQNLEQIPSSILQSPHSPTCLVSLDLSRNKLAELPASIGSLRSLQTLNLSRNRILVLPHEIGNLSALVTLNLLSNKLRPVARSIPPTISNCTSLKVLDLRYNLKIKPSAVNTLNQYFSSHETRAEVRITDKSKPSDFDMNNKDNEINNGHFEHACDRDANLLQSQLEPLSTPTLRRRLEEDFGVSVDITNYGSRPTIMKELLQAYQTAGADPRTNVYFEGRPVSTQICNELLHELQDWVTMKIRERPKIRADHYMILRSPLEFGSKDSAKAKLAAGKLQRHQRLWDLATRALQEVDADFSKIFTALAVTHNFQGSPHIDTQNIGPFYGLSLGDYNSGGGRLCVEMDATHVAQVDTRGKLAKVDGRFVHWVGEYTGTRYSLIYYQTIGTATPQTTAVLPLPKVNGDFVEAATMPS